MTKASSASSADRPALTPATVALLVETGVTLALARLAVVCVSFERLSPALGAHGEQTPAVVNPDTADALARIGWAIGAVARRTPWRSKCLEQAITAQALLKRRGLESTLYLGIARDETGDAAPHAWLRSGAVHVTGGAHVDHYAVVASYARSRR